MNSTNRFRCVAFLLLLTVAGFGAIALAQMGGEIAANMAENSKKLKQYTYLQKTQVYLRGDLRNTKLAQVHFDSVTGEKISVPVESDSSDQSAGGRRNGPLRSRIVEKKKEEMKDYVESLIALMGKYLPPNGEKIKAALPKAEIIPPAAGIAKIVLKDYVKPGDRMTLSVNADSRKLEQIAIASKLDDDPVSFQVDFARLPDGTNYPSLTKIKSEAKQLELRVTTSDYHK